MLATAATFLEQRPPIRCGDFAYPERFYIVAAGDTITLYGIGFGNVTPRVEAGRAATGTTALICRSILVRWTFGTLRYAGLAPSFLGLYQFNVVMPAMSAGDVALKFTLGGQQSQQALYLAVRP